MIMGQSKELKWRRNRSYHHRLYHLIQECKTKQDPVAGKILYTIAAFNSLDGSARFGDHLIQLFTSCNCPHDAESAFTHIMKHTLYTWNANGYSPYQQ